ncbi:FadR/GntR family transcriptional regulator [Actinomycetospora termitidis]|uniref:FCD domain-containing protein n=1 Tax=Actinomycetospora termitidis TaxID=3053470 RepID=A0ABT7MDX6_9PSEU|nr:FCD domain-containing protein [Actinomycetospora sp. Odt1-22]MDL5158871.1 FCD domain-containing protein [Actinomycetospora sp. Odt1-22]
MTPVVTRLRALLDESVAEGRLGTGAKIPTERALQDVLQASRTAVRSALAELEREGRITRHVGRGTFLAELEGGPELPAAARTTLQTSPAEIMATRLVLEPEIAALAARHATPADVDHVRHCLQRGNATGTYEEFEAWDSALHRAIATAAHNGLLLRLFDTMNAARDLPVWGSIKRRSATPERRQGYECSHGEIVEALVERDADAARDHMRAHLVDVRTNLLGVH